MSPLRVTALLLTFAMASPALAHPGSGIVVDRNGNVYFVVPGSNAIMRLGRDGKALPFVTDERLRLPHHLVQHRDGALFVASDHDGRVWRVGTDGSIHEHFNSFRVRQRDRRAEITVGSVGDPFTVDSAGNVYALDVGLGSAVVRITPEGNITPIASSAEFGDLHFSSMAWGADRALYLTDEHRVWRIMGDSATPIQPRGTQLERATGTVIDSSGNVYVADYSGGRVVRFALDGSVNTPPAIERLRLRNPTGVTLAGADVYVLDSPGGGVEIWRVQGGEAERLYSRMSGAFYLRWAMPVVLVVLLALVIVNSVLQARARRQQAATQPG